MLKRLALPLVALVAAAGVAVATSATAESAPSASSGSAKYQALRSGMIVGFYDDEQVYGRTDWAFSQLRSLRAGIVRFTIDWSTVAKRRPVGAGGPVGSGVQLDRGRQRRRSCGRGTGSAHWQRFSGRRAGRALRRTACRGA